MRRKRTELVRVGLFVAEVPVEIITDEDDWSPAMSLEDALKLERTEQALVEGDVVEAAKYGRVFELKPVTA